MKWRLIPLRNYPAPLNMAIDDALAESVLKSRIPAIRFYKWKGSAVSIGINQNQNEINLDLCKKLGVDVVRRMTGGAAVFHDKNDLTYSVIAPIELFGDIQKAYFEI